MITHLIVLSSSDISLEENTRWDIPDMEVTGSTNKLQAVWPSLRHGQYAWKVVKEGGVVKHGYTHHAQPHLYEDFPCSHPQTLACGQSVVCILGILINITKIAIICQVLKSEIILA